MRISELLLLHHTHSDIGYTNPQPVFWELSRQFIDQAIDLCEATSEYPDDSKMRWTCEVTSTVLHWLDHRRRIANQTDAGAGAQPADCIRSDVGPLERDGS